MYGVQYGTLVVVMLAVLVFLVLLFSYGFNKAVDTALFLASAGLLSSVMYDLVIYDGGSMRAMFCKLVLGFVFLVAHLLSVDVDYWSLLKRLRLAFTHGRVRATDELIKAVGGPTIQDLANHRHRRITGR